MEKLLIVDACVRGTMSRTSKLANRFIDLYCDANPDMLVEAVNLCALRLEPQYPEVLAQRDALCQMGKLGHPMFDLAHQFADADRIIIAAPFWDLDYPAILKIYLERISMADITFGYDEIGNPKGLCKAKKLLLITTRGWAVGGTEMECATAHLKALCKMYGIEEFLCLDAEGLDDDFQDPKEIMNEALARAEALVPTF